MLDGWKWGLRGWCRFLGAARPPPPHSLHSSPTIRALLQLQHGDGVYMDMVRTRASYCPAASCRLTTIPYRDVNRASVALLPSPSTFTLHLLYLHPPSGFIPTPRNTTTAPGYVPYCMITSANLLTTSLQPDSLRIILILTLKFDRSDVLCCNLICHLLTLSMYEFGG